MMSTFLQLWSKIWTELRFTSLCDIATAMYRARTYNFVKSIYVVVGQEQSNHFRQAQVCT